MLLFSLVLQNVMNIFVSVASYGTIQAHLTLEGSIAICHWASVSEPHTGRVESIYYLSYVVPYVFGAVI